MSRVGICVCCTLNWNALKIQTQSANDLSWAYGVLRTFNYISTRTQQENCSPLLVSYECPRHIIDYSAAIRVWWGELVLFSFFPSWPMHKAFRVTHVEKEKWYLNLALDGKLSCQVAESIRSTWLDLISSARSGARSRSLARIHHTHNWKARHQLFNSRLAHTHALLCGHFCALCFVTALLHY